MKYLWQSTVQLSDLMMVGLLSRLYTSPLAFGESRWLRDVYVIHRGSYIKHRPGAHVAAWLTGRGQAEVNYS